jgi:hypothetical protein
MGSSWSSRRKLLAHCGAYELGHGQIVGADLGYPTHGGDQNKERGISL